MSMRGHSSMGGDATSVARSTASDTRKTFVGSAMPFAYLYSFARHLKRRHVVGLIAVGLGVRLCGAFLYGTQDMEFWKAYGTYLGHQSLTGVYGAKDADILLEWHKGKRFGEVVKATQRIIPYKPHNDWRNEYRMVQPPIYVYSLFACAKAYQVVSPKLTNNRLFNFFLNLEPIISSGLIALVVFWFAAQAGGVALGQLCGLAYWLSPLVILNAPVQGYRDPLCVLFAVLSVMLTYHKRLPGALVCLVLALSTKPQGVLIAPVILAVGLRDFSFAANLKAWALAIMAGLLVALPYLLSGHFLSMVQGVLTINQVSHDLSRQAMNVWWPVQYGVHATSAVRHGTVGLLTGILGGPYGWVSDVPAATLTPRLGFNIEIIGLALLVAFTTLNLRFVLSRTRSDRSAIIVAAALQVYGYFILRVGVQANHYFILVALLTMVCCLSDRGLPHLVLVSTLFFLQALIFYGLGRDFNPGVTLLGKFYLGWTTVVLALANVLVFIYLCTYYYRTKRVPANIPCAGVGSDGSARTSEN